MIHLCKIIRLFHTLIMLILTTNEKNEIISNIKSMSGKLWEKCTALMSFIKTIKCIYYITMLFCTLCILFYWFILSPFLTIYGLLAQLLHILLMTSHLFRVTMFNLLNNKYNIFLPSITVIISLIFVHQYGQQNLHWLSAQNKTTTIKTTKRAYNNTVKTKQRERIKRGKCEV